MKGLLKTFIYSTGILFLYMPIKAFAISSDTAISAVIRQQLSLHRHNLNYPASVQRFYNQEEFRLVWLVKDTVKTPAMDVLLLFDCVLQYGLNPVDYHPQEFTYDSLHIMQTTKISNSKKAYFDIRMTDAIITFINNLHYGKLNPQFSASRVDADNIAEFKADYVLINALDQKDRMGAIVNVQPNSEAYTNMQHYMELLITKYSGSNYVKPEKAIHKLAINMERLRWISSTGRANYLTCLVREGIMTYYKDIYNEDKGLVKALYK